MSTACVAGYYGMPEPLDQEIESLRGRYQAITFSAVTPTQKSEIAHVGMKLAELLHLVRSSRATRRDAVAIPLLASWIAGRIDSIEAQRQNRPLFFSRAR
jgi:hypothetical protein